MLVFCNSSRQKLRTLLTIFVTEAEAEAISVAGVVVVGIAVVVDITEVVGVARIRRDLPPVVRTASATT